MICYRVYVNLRQDKPIIEEKMRVQTLAREYFEVFTVFNTINYSLDNFERGICLEVISGEYLDNVGDFCKAVKALLSYDQVILTQSRVLIEVF